MEVRIYDLQDPKRFDVLTIVCCDENGNELGTHVVHASGGSLSIFKSHPMGPVRGRGPVSAGAVSQSMAADSCKSPEVRP